MLHKKLSAFHYSIADLNEITNKLRNNLFSDADIEAFTKNLTLEKFLKLSDFTDLFCDLIFILQAKNQLKIFLINLSKDSFSWLFNKENYIFEKLEKIGFTEIIFNNFPLERIHELPEEFKSKFSTS